MKVMKAMAVVGVAVSLLFGNVFELTAASTVNDCNHQTLNFQEIRLSDTTYTHYYTFPGGTSVPCIVTTPRYRHVVICTQCGKIISERDTSGTPVHSVSHP